MPGRDRCGPPRSVDAGPAAGRARASGAPGGRSRTVAAGAGALTGGRRLSEGAFARGPGSAPTVRPVVENAMAILPDEIFGPSVPILRVADFEEGLRRAGERRHRLSASVFTRDLRRVTRAARDLRFGATGVDRPGGFAVHAFRTGILDSGLGGEDGDYGLEGHFRKTTVSAGFA